MNESTDLSCESRYNNLIKANSEIAPETLPKKRKNKGILSSNKSIQRAREELTSAAAKNHIRSMIYTKQHLEEAEDNLDSIYQQEMEKCVKGKTETIEKLHVERRGAQAWKTMHEVTNRKVHLRQKSKVPLRVKGYKAGTITLKIFLEKRILMCQTLAAPFSITRFLIPFQLTAANSC